jgi:MerR family transcriptional regulator/heat shock protein HspR
MNFDDSEPCYVISVVARMLGVHAQTLRYYERVGVIEPSRSMGRVRLYSNRDIERLRHVRTLMNDLGVNLAGVEVILRLTERLAAMERQIEEMELEIRRLREAGL